jgi:hypothetical protein
MVEADLNNRRDCIVVIYHSNSTYMGLALYGQIQSCQEIHDVGRISQCHFVLMSA